MLFEHVRAYYDVPAQMGLEIHYKGKRGLISKDCRHYIGATFDEDKPTVVHHIHPTDPNLKYGTTIRKLRKPTRSQRRYRDYIESEYEGTFAEYLGIWR